MPNRPGKPCAQPMCSAVVAVGTSYCEAHRKANYKRENEARADWSNKLYGRRWRKARRHFLMEYPLCKHCAADGRTVAASVVDHIRDHQGDVALFWDRTNWQPLCNPCHNRKTAREGRVKSL